MRVFVYEYTCARPGEPASLAAEGWAMLSAVLDDLRRVPGVTVVTLLHAAFPHRPPGVEVQHVNGREEALFRSQVRRSTASLVIAPEFDGLLHERCRWVEEEGGRLLGPSSAAVALTADKLRLAEHLARHGVATPPCAPAGAGPLPFAFPIVLKPRDGAGSMATFRVRSADVLAAALHQARQEGCRGEMIVQPFVEGVAASVALLIGPAGEVPLPPAEQHLSDDGRFHYRGGVLPLRSGLAALAAALAVRAVRSVPGLAGYVGVDVVLGDGGDAVIEINPRLTTSYVGLRALGHDNLMGALLRTVRGEKVSLTWRKDVAHFRADGRVGP